MPYGSLQDLALGVAPGVDPTLGDPTAPPPQPEQFQTSGVQSLLEAIYNGMGNVQLPPARGFGQGFAQGLVGSLGGQGSKIAAARQRFEADQASRRAATDAERRAATTEARKESGAARRAADAEQARLRREQQVYEQEHPIPSAKQLDAAPWLARAVGPDGRISRSVLEGAGKPEKPTHEPREPMLIIQTPDGPRYVPASQAAGKAPPTKATAVRPASGVERQTFAFWQRGKDSLDTISAPDKSGQTLEQRVGLNPASQARLSLPNYFQNPDQQVYRQAQRQFSEARLRKESGAAISAKEYESDAKTYFAQPGDSPAVIERKQKSRQKVLDGLKFGAGKAYDEFFNGSQGSDGEDEYDYDPHTGGLVRRQ